MFMQHMRVLQKRDQFFSKHCVILTREYLALNVYVALCYYKLDYYDVSQVIGAGRLTCINT